MNRIRISPAPPPAADYDVIVEPGALDRLGALVSDAAPAYRYAVIADDRVAALHGARILGALRGRGLQVGLHVFPAGEASKSREVWAALTDALLADGVGRDAAVIALGGGVTGDLAGFVAATYMRGLPLVHLPTSLLAMVDSSVGGKTGVDTPGGKNLVGAFHPPRLVIADPLVLSTLPERELRAGLAEAVKHGAIADPAYFARIRTEADRLLGREPEALAALVRRSVEIKAEVVAADPFEAGRRAVLNFGHTIGHAIEAITRYATSHGQAVAIGMVAEARAGELAGITAPGTEAALRDALACLGLPVGPPSGVDPAAVMAVTRSDKKARGDRARYTLLARIGEVARTAEGAWTAPLDDARVEQTLADLASR